MEGEGNFSATDAGVCLGGACLGNNNMATENWAEVAEDVIRQAVDEIIARTSDIPFQGKLIRVGPEVVYANAGTRNGAKSGDRFSVYSPGEELIDPDTGESLGNDMMKVGSISLIDVKEKFSRAEVTTGGSFEQGFVIVPQEEAESGW